MSVDMIDRRGIHAPLGKRRRGNERIGEKIRVDASERIVAERNAKHGKERAGLREGPTSGARGENVLRAAWLSAGDMVKVGFRPLK